MSAVKLIRKDTSKITKLEDIRKISDMDEFYLALNLMQKEYSIIDRNGQHFVFSIDRYTNREKYSMQLTHNVMFKYLHLDIKTEKGADKRLYVTDYFYDSQYTNRLQGIIFNPKEKPGIVSYKGHKFYNVWKGFKYEPIMGDTLKFDYLVKVNCNHNEDLYEYFMNYLAHAIQKPWEIPMTAIVIRGSQGSGKGNLISNTILALSENSKYIEDIEQLVGQFNGHMSDAFFVLADEVSFGGNKKEANKLKTFISEKTRTINDKMKTAYTVDAYSRTFILSNNDFIVNVESTDRRYIVCEASDELANEEGRKWFEEYNKWLHNGGFNAIMYDLLHRDISNFNPRNLVKTKAKSELQYKSSDLDIKFLIDWLQDEIEIKNDFKRENKIPNGSDYFQKEFFHLFQEWVSTYHNKSSYVPNEREFRKTLNKAFNFDKDEPTWKTKWKLSGGVYVYRFKDKTTLKSLFAENIFKDKVENIFEK